MPSGLIAIWKGSTSTIPTGWVICNGQNGTPDLRDKFVLGAGNAYSVSNTGGEETHTLTIDEMPSHTHNLRKSYDGSLFSIKAYGVNTGASTPEALTDGGLGGTSIILENVGGGQAHNNMPPYYALCYIMKT